MQLYISNYPGQQVHVELINDGKKYYNIKPSTKASKIIRVMAYITPKFAASRAASLPASRSTAKLLYYLV